jgi:hypothetical protein
MENFLTTYTKLNAHNLELLASIHFQFHHQLRLADEGYVQWQMVFSHPRLNGGEDSIVAGASYLRFNDSGKVYFHRDYFDLGAMLYRNTQSNEEN